MSTDLERLPPAERTRLVADSVRRLVAQAELVE
jgi:hypothetical protein